MSSISSSKARWRVGVARRVLNPRPGVELAGLGYYLNRTWQRICDDLTATALVVSDEQGGSVALVAMDLMYNDAFFTANIRSLVAAQTDIPPEAIGINCPTAIMRRQRDLSVAAGIKTRITFPSQQRKLPPLSLKHGE